MIRRAACLLSLLIGCGDDLRSGRDAGSCSAEDCAPYACAAGGEVCLRSCRGADECAPAHACVSGACVGTECDEGTAREVCGPYACINGTCAADCAIAPCADGFYCRGNQNECVPNCTEPDDPVCEGYLCTVEFGECEVFCDDQVPCAEGYTCDENAQCH